jgi:hypothetical protein
MKIEYKLAPRMSLAEFARLHGLTMVVTDGVNSDGDVYYLAKFRDVLNTTGLAAGVGTDPEKAIRDYELKISGKDIMLKNKNGELIKKRVVISEPYLSKRDD